MENNVIVGARAIFRIEGKKVGYASDVTVRRDIQLEDIDVLDNVEVQEHAKLGIRVSMTCRIFRLPNKSLIQAGIFPTDDNILTAGTLTATITDRNTGATLAQLLRVTTESDNINFGARAVSADDVTFRAIRMKDEAEVVT
jgi:hypothetical protein